MLQCILFMTINYFFKYTFATTKNDKRILKRSTIHLLNPFAINDKLPIPSQTNPLDASNVRMQDFIKSHSTTGFLNHFHSNYNHYIAWRELCNRFCILNPTKKATKRPNSKSSNSQIVEKIQKTTNFLNDKIHSLSSINTIEIPSEIDKLNIVDAKLEAEAQINTFDFVQLLINYLKILIYNKKTDISSYFDLVGEKRELANSCLLKMKISTIEKKSGENLNQANECNSDASSSNKDTHHIYQIKNQNLMQANDLKLNQLKNSNFLSMIDDNNVTKAVDKVFSLINCTFASHRKNFKPDSNIYVDTNRPNFLNNMIYYETYRFILDYENDIMTKFFNGSNLITQNTFEFINDYEVKDINKKIKLHPQTFHKDFKNQKISNINANIKSSIFNILKYDNKEYLRNDFFIPEIQHPETFFELDFLDNLQFTDYVKSILKVDAFVDVNFNTKSSYFFTKNCLDFIKLVIFSDKYLSTGLNNSAANWETVYDKICSVFEAKNNCIKHVFQELLFFKSYYFKENFDVIATKKTFSIGQVLFFLCIFEKIVEFDWRGKINDLNIQRLNIEADKTRECSDLKTNKYKDINYITAKIKLQSFILAYTTTYRILGVLLHPFLMPVDYEGYLYITIALLYKYKSAYLGNRNSNLNKEGCVLPNKNFNFLKNIMFITPCNLKNVNLNFYLNRSNKGNKLMSKKINCLDNRFAQFSILYFFSDKNIDIFKNYSQISDNRCKFNLFSIVLYYHIFFKKLLEIKAIKTDTDLDQFNKTLSKFLKEYQHMPLYEKKQIFYQIYDFYHKSLKLQQLYDFSII